MRRQGAGFTLVELMVGIAIMVLLALAAVPFTREWVDGTRQMQTRSFLLEGVAQARALALRNPSGEPSSTPAAILQLDGTRLEVVAAGNTAPAWTGTIADGAVLKLTDKTDFAGAAALAGSNNQAFTCVAFDSRGARLADAAGCDQTVASQGRVAIGLRNQEPVYADLL